MAGFTDTAKNAMLDNQLPSGSASLSLHSGDPGGTGANEISGGSPAYARKTVTLTAASGGVKTHSSGSQTFDVPAGATVAYVGVWVSSVFRCGFALPSPKYYATQGTLDLAAPNIRLV